MHRGPVLVVEDDRDVREAIRDTLADEGYDTAEAGDGQAGLEWLRSHPHPPVILLDWNMAPMNGPRFLSEVSRDPALARIPIVLLTADVKVREKATSHSLAGWLRKPVDLGKLFEIVGRYAS